MFSIPLATAVLKTVYDEGRVSAMPDVHGDVGESDVAVNMPTSCDSCDAYLYSTV